jgi:predicted O-methyltransferase YrrM
MSDATQSQGYVVDAEYADTFFRELSPAWLNYVAASNGSRPCVVEEPFTYLELGCGFGQSVIVNAAAFPRGEFHGCDYNPAHIERARRYAAALAVSNVEFHEASFEQLLERDLPPFDFIVLHGVYSWVNADVRRTSRRLLVAGLKPGGLVYVSYNCMPGWAGEAPLRKLLVELAATAEGSAAERAQHAVGILRAMNPDKLRYFGANPAAFTALDAYAKASPSYLAHEFLNQAWEPFYSIDVGEEMASIGLSYVGSATLADNYQALLADDGAAAAAAKLATQRQRQLAIDFAVDRRFRRDVFVRAQAPLDAAEIAAVFRNAVIGCLDSPQRIGNTAKVPRGEIRFRDDFVAELQSLFAKGSTTIGAAVAALHGDGRNAVEIARNLTYLVAAGTLLPFARVHDGGATGTAVRSANATVARVLAAMVEQGVRRAVPSEVFGNGVEIEPIEALAVTEFLAGANRPEALAARLRTAADDLPNGDRSARDAARRAIEDVVPRLVRLGVLV